jgi:threonine synthase
MSLGEGDTPLVAFEDLHLKLESTNPTGSFKDRGAVLLATEAVAAGARLAVCDSSGNAGIAAATYFARAGIPIEVYVPEAAPAAKVEAIAAAGAVVVRVDGPRAAAARAAASRVEQTGAYYASHVHRAVFLDGTARIAVELVAQLGREPATVVVPVGNGSLLLGLALGFDQLRAGGAIAALPRLVAVQAAGCAPLASAFAAGLDTPQPVAPGTTVADGIAIAEPALGARILAAVRASGGTIVAVDDAAILAAQARLAAAGQFVEATGAVALAGTTAGGARAAPVVVLVTGTDRTQKHRESVSVM